MSRVTRSHNKKRGQDTPKCRTIKEKCRTFLNKSYKINMYYFCLFNWKLYNIIQLLTVIFYDTTYKYLYFILFILLYFILFILFYLLNLYLNKNSFDILKSLPHELNCIYQMNLFYSKCLDGLKYIYKIQSKTNA